MISCIKCSEKSHKCFLVSCGKTLSNVSSANINVIVLGDFNTDIQDMDDLREENLIGFALKIYTEKNVLQLINLFT